MSRLPSDRNAAEQASSQATPLVGLVSLRRSGSMVRWRLAALALAFLQAWAYRYDANPDGISYLDLADAYRRESWYAATNGYWSPLYPWLLAVASVVIRPSPRLEFPMAHGVNFLTFILALAAFEFFLRELFRSTSLEPASQSEPASAHWCALAYALFIWASLRLIDLGTLTPDLLIVASVLAAMGLLARSRRFATWRTAAPFGLALGLGFLAKSVMFSLAPVFLAVAATLWRPWRRSLRLTTVAAGTFILVTGPHVAALSASRGRFTFGETGRLAYAWFVNGVPFYTHWQGNPRGYGVPVHPTRQLLESPETYAFEEPFPVTYPPWYDPSYWYEGVKPRFHIWQQASVVLHHLPAHVELLGLPFLLLLAACVAARSATGPLPVVGRLWWLVVPGAVALGLYALVLVRTRYAAPFAVPLWLGMLSAALWSATPEWRRGLAIAISVILVLSVIPRLTPSRRALLFRNETWTHATAVHDLGVRPGDRVATLGDGQFLYWPRLARVRIVAEVPARSVQNFWSSPPEIQDSVIRAFRAVGAKAVVAVDAPATRSDRRWITIPNSPYSVLMLGGS